MTVDEMLTRMSSRELSEWSVFFKLEAQDVKDARSGGGGGGGSQDFPGPESLMGQPHNN
jgi:hypothetical protein